MPNYPSLAELMAAMKDNGAADAVTAATEGFNKGRDNAAAAQKRREDFQNKIKELGLLEQKTATDAKEADIKEKTLAQNANNFIPAENTGVDSLKTLGSRPVPASVLSAQIKADNQQPKLSPAQTVVDKEFGKDYNDFVTQGGFGGAINTIKRVRAAAEGLNSGNETVNRASSFLPESAQGIVAPNYKASRQDIEAGVINTLRQTYGPQFTEGEGTRLLRLTFDPTLPTAVNQGRVKRLLDSLETAVHAKKEASDYYEKNGTLVGFQGTLPNMSSLADIVVGSDPTPSTPATSPAQSAPAAQKKTRTLKSGVVVTEE